MNTSLWYYGLSDSNDLAHDLGNGFGQSVYNTILTYQSVLEIGRTGKSEACQSDQLPEQTDRSV